MCYNLSINKNIGSIEKRFHALFQNPDMFTPFYHISAFSIPLIPVILNKKPDSIQLFHWGLIPFWVKDKEFAEKIRFKTFNARSETVHEKPSYRTSIKNKRCLVIVDGFFEWREHNGKKYPYYIYMPDNTAFALAGIWDSWLNKKTNENLNTFSILTTGANPLLEKIHNTKKRMPVILKKENERKWIDESLNKDAIDTLMLPYDEDNLETHTVSKLVSVRKEDSNVPGAIEEFHFKDLPGLS